jgi:hypothetical protein
MLPPVARSRLVIQAFWNSGNLAVRKSKIQSVEVRPEAACVMLPIAPAGAGLLSSTKASSSANTDATIPIGVIASLVIRTGFPRLVWGPGLLTVLHNRRSE